MWGQLLWQADFLGEAVSFLMLYIQEHLRSDFFLCA